MLRMSERPHERGRWRHLPALLVSLAFLLPVWFMLTGSLRVPGAAPTPGVTALPIDPSVESFRRALALVPLGRFALNSVLVVVAAVPLTVVFASWAGFAISRLSPRARGIMVAVSLVALMVPSVALLVPRFALFRTLGLTNTYVPLIAPSLLGTSPFYVLIFVWAFRRLPQDFFDAGRVAGLSWLGVWWRVAMPLVRPVAVAVGVLAFVFTWGNFLDPLIYLFDESMFTLPLGLRSLSTVGPQDAPVFLAGAVLATAPVVGAFLYAQRFFLREHRESGWLGR